MAVEIVLGRMPMIDDDGVFPPGFASQDRLDPSPVNPALTQEELGAMVEDLRLFLDDKEALRNANPGLVRMLYGHLGLMLRGLD